MMRVSSHYPLAALLLTLLFVGLPPSRTVAAGYGTLAGMVSDGKGIPLMGATVMIIGPTALATEATDQTIERLITDAHGRFTIAHLVPGWYSLKVTSPTRLPAMRSGVRVDAGETVVASFVLTDAFAPIRFQMPNNTVSSWGDEWKWVLRTSATTRPILRYRSEPAVKTKVSAQERKATLPPTERLAGILPGSTLRDPLAEDLGMADVFAYLRPLTVNSDILAEASYSALGAASATVGTLLTRNELKGEPQQFGVAVHQFSLVPEGPFPAGAPSAFGQVRGMAATMSETRLLAPKVTVTAGMDVSVFSAFDNVYAAQPHASLEYQATPATVVSAEYSSGRAETPNSLPERLALLNAFPQLTERNGRLAMEQLHHTQVAVNHRLGKSARVQAAAYHDMLHNAAVWGLGNPAYTSTFTGYVLPNPAGNGSVINGGNYQSNGLRAVYARTFGSHLEVLGAYSSGTALSAREFNAQKSFSYSPGMLTPERTNSVVGKITAEIPGAHTASLLLMNGCPRTA